MNNTKKTKKTTTKVRKNVRKTAEKKAPRRDITSYVTKQMLIGNIASVGIPRSEIESALERYCNENPTVDATDMPLVGLYDKTGENAVVKAVIALSKKHCGERGSRSAVFSKDGLGVILFGKSAREIVSKVVIGRNAEVEHLKTKIKVRCDFPVNKKMKCFGGEKVSDHI